MGLLKHLVALFMVSFGCATAQTSYVGSGSTIYFNKEVLTNQPIEVAATGTVNMTAGSLFTGLGFVRGTVNVLGAEATTVPVGDGPVKSAVNITTAANTDNIAVTYFGTAPSGTLDPSLSTYALSDAEYWKVTKTAGTAADVAVSGLANIASTYGGEPPIGAPVLVRRNNASSNWVLYSANPGFGEFAYAAETLPLSSGTFDASAFAFYPNPANGSVTDLFFSLPNSIEQLDITVYDVTGKTVQHYPNVPVQVGQNSISKPQVASGVYFMQFLFNNGEHTVTKRLIIN